MDEKFLSSQVKGDDRSVYNLKKVDSTNDGFLTATSIIENSNKSHECSVKVILMTATKYVEDLQNVEFEKEKFVMTKNQLVMYQSAYEAEVSDLQLYYTTALAQMENRSQTCAKRLQIVLDENLIKQETIGNDLKSQVINRFKIHRMTMYGIRQRMIVLASAIRIIQQCITDSSGFVTSIFQLTTRSRITAVDFIKGEDIEMFDWEGLSITKKSQLNILLMIELAVRALAREWGLASPETCLGSLKLV